MKPLLITALLIGASLTLSACSAYKEVGLCSYLGGCEDDDDDGDK